MDTEYEYVVRDFGRLLGQSWLHRISTELWKFSQSLRQWLHEQAVHPPQTRRERLATFLAEQEAAGFIVTPEGRAELEAYLEGWANKFNRSEHQPSSPAVVQPQIQTVSLTPVVELRTENDAAPHTAKMLSHPPTGAVLAKTVSHRKPQPSLYGDAPADSYQGQFNRWLRVADGYLDDIEKLLDPLGKKVADAKTDEAVEVETDVDEIASLIGAHNDAMENAREQWLEGDLGREAFDYLMLARSPASLWLPMFVNPQQAKRAQEQWKEIGVRLKERIAFLDNVIFAMEVTEYVGEAASLAIGAGFVVNAVKTGGKIALVKLVAQAAIAEGAAAVTDAASQAVEDALLAAGVSQETISTIQTGATVVAFVLELKRMGTSLRNPPSKFGTPFLKPKGPIAKADSPPGFVNNTSSGPTPQSILVGRQPAPRVDGSASLPTINSHFTPDPTKIVGSEHAYSTAFRITLPSTAFPGRTRGMHFQEANQQLLEAMDADPQFAQQMESLIPNLRSQLVKPKSISREPPSGWTWHHHVETGVLELMPRVQHEAAGKLQQILHPGGRGGMKLWGE